MKKKTRSHNTLIRAGQELLYRTLDTMRPETVAKTSDVALAAVLQLELSEQFVTNRYGLPEKVGPISAGNIAGYRVKHGLPPFRTVRELSPAQQRKAIRLAEQETKREAKRLDREQKLAARAAAFENKQTSALQAFVPAPEKVARQKKSQTPPELQRLQGTLQEVRTMIATYVMSTQTQVGILSDDVKNAFKQLQLSLGDILEKITVVTHQMFTLDTKVRDIQIQLAKPITATSSRPKLNDDAQATVQPPPPMPPICRDGPPTAAMADTVLDQPSDQLPRD